MTISIIGINNRMHVRMDCADEMARRPQNQMGGSSRGVTVMRFVNVIIGNQLGQLQLHHAESDWGTQ